MPSPSLSGIATIMYVLRTVSMPANSKQLPSYTSGERLRYGACLLLRLYDAHLSLSPFVRECLLMLRAFPAYSPHCISIAIETVTRRSLSLVHDVCASLVDVDVDESSLTGSERRALRDAQLVVSPFPLSPSSSPTTEATKMAAPNQPAASLAPPASNGREWLSLPEVPTSHELTQWANPGHGFTIPPNQLEGAWPSTGKTLPSPSILICADKCTTAKYLHVQYAVCREESVFALRRALLALRNAPGNDEPGLRPESAGICLYEKV